MKSNMSCLTKKSLFFMVLSIVCNPTFSDRIGECIANVRHVFNEAMLPYFAFNFAMFSLSDSVIKSMTTAAELANHFKENKYAIFQYGNTDLNEKHEELIDYFSFAVNQTEDRSNTSLESKKEDILGYFKSLIVKVEKARFKYEPQKFIVEPTGLINEPSRLINVPPRFIAEPTVPFFPQFTMSPKQFCKEVYKGEDNYKCRASLAVMFRKGEDDLKEMDIKEAFIYCYRYYTHLDFTMYNTEITDNLLLQKKLTGGSQEERLKWALNCMVNYFSHLMNVAYGISAVHMNISDSFPTVEDYCKSAVQLQHKGKHSIVSKSISFKK